MEPMCVAREGGNDILSHVDFSKIWDVIKYFNELKKYIGKEDTTFPFLSIPRQIKWRNEHPI